MLNKVQIILKNSVQIKIFINVVLQSDCVVTKGQPVHN